MGQLGFIVSLDCFDKKDFTSSFPILTTILLQVLHVAFALGSRRWFLWIITLTLNYLPQGLLMGVLASAFSHSQPMKRHQNNHANAL
jgi:hypothetical protein